MDKHKVVPGDQVKVVDQYNSHNPALIGVVLEVVPSGGVISSHRIKLVVPGGVTWRWNHEVCKI